MKVSKRLLSMFVALIMVISTMAVATISVSADTDYFPAYNAAKANLTIGKMQYQNVGKADEVTVPVKIAKNPGIWGANFQVAFDSHLTFVKAENGNVLAAAPLESHNDKYVTLYIDNNNEFVNSTVNGTLVNLTFSIKAEDAVVGKTYPISFTYVTDNDDGRLSIINAETKDVDLTYDNGYVTVVKPLATPATAKISSVVLTKKNIAKVTWGKAANATKYEVYRKIGSGGYSKVATTTALSFTNSGLAAGKTYTYAVKTINVTKAGALSAAKSVSTLSTSKPAKPQLKAAKKAITITRKTKTFGASGYQVQYSLKSNFKKATTKNIATKLTAKKLKAKTKYYVRIRAVKKISGSTVYGTWSAAASIKTK